MLESDDEASCLFSSEIAEIFLSKINVDFSVFLSGVVTVIDFLRPSFFLSWFRLSFCYPL